MIKPQPYIGVTGFMSRVEVQAALDAFPVGCGRLLMIGVLASSKTLAGQPNRWPLRYPAQDRIASLFPDDPRALNLVHYATGGEQSPEKLADDLMRAMRAGWPLAHGLQINAAWPSPRALELFREHYGAERVVLQLGPRAMKEMNYLSWYIADRVRAEYGPLISDVLIDASGGTGRPLDAELARRLFDALREAGDWGIGVAGGLCAGALGADGPVAALMRDGASIDAEGRLRDDTPGGGNLNRAEMEAYLVMAGRAVRP